MASPSEVDRWISSGPTAVGLGAVVAVLACALSQRRGSRRAAWIAITVGVAVIAIIRAVVPEVASLDLLIALIVVKVLQPVRFWVVWLPSVGIAPPRRTPPSSACLPPSSRFARSPAGRAG
ncbi:hypothetical protein ACETU7_32315 [Rhodococcus sp. 3Y1]